MRGSIEPYRAWCPPQDDQTAQVEHSVPANSMRQFFFYMGGNLEIRYHQFPWINIIIVLINIGHLEGIDSSFRQSQMMAWARSHGLATLLFAGWLHDAAPLAWRQCSVALLGVPGEQHAGTS